MKTKKFFKLLKENNRQFLFLFVCVIFLILAKKYFFMSLFILLNYFVLWLKFGIGFDSPIEVISFGTFMSSYVYGPLEGVIVAGSSLVAISLTGRIKISKLSTNVILFMIAGLTQLLRNVNVSTAGILILVFKYSFDAFFYLVIYRDADYFRKIPTKLVNALFWVLIYLRFGQNIVSLMAL